MLLAFLISTALAGTKNVTAAAAIDPASIPVNTTAHLTSTMCNAGDAFVGGTAFLGTYLPLSMRYTIVSMPGVCRATRAGGYQYIFCTVSLNPGYCQDVEIDVTPTTRGDTVLYISADSANVLRETNELDNRASVILTAY